MIFSSIMMAPNIVHLLTLFVLGYDVGIFWCLLMLLSYLQNTRETAFALRKFSLTKAKRYLEDVIAHKQAILLRLSLATQMGRDAGLSSLLDSF